MTEHEDPMFFEEPADEIEYFREKSKRLRAERDAAIAERDTYYSDYLRRHKDACERWMEVQMLRAQADKLAEALRALVDLDERSGWHSKQQDAARAALAEYDAASREGGAQKEQ